jgi:hypothetical protein
MTKKPARRFADGGNVGSPLPRGPAPAPLPGNVGGAVGPPAPPAPPLGPERFPPGAFSPKVRAAIGYGSPHAYGRGGEVKRAAGGLSRPAKPGRCGT